VQCPCSAAWNLDSPRAPGECWQSCPPRCRRIWECPKDCIACSSLAPRAAGDQGGPYTQRRSRVKISVCANPSTKRRRRSFAPEQHFVTLSSHTDNRSGNKRDPVGCRDDHGDPRVYWYRRAILVRRIAWARCRRDLHPTDTVPGAVREPPHRRARMIVMRTG